MAQATAGGTVARDLLAVTAALAAAIGLLLHPSAFVLAGVVFPLTYVLMAHEVDQATVTDEAADAVDAGAPVLHQWALGAALLLCVLLLAAQYGGRPLPRWLRFAALALMPLGGIATAAALATAFGHPAPRPPPLRRALATVLALASSALWIPMAYLVDPAGDGNLALLASSATVSGAAAGAVGYGLARACTRPRRVAAPARPAAAEGSAP